MAYLYKGGFNMSNDKNIIKTEVKINLCDKCFHKDVCVKTFNKEEIDKCYHIITYEEILKEAWGSCSKFQPKKLNPQSEYAGVCPSCKKSIKKLIEGRGGRIINFCYKCGQRVTEICAISDKEAL
jgi:hypothetical protein